MPDEDLPGGGPPSPGADATRTALEIADAAARACNVGSYASGAQMWERFLEFVASMPDTSRLGVAVPKAHCYLGDAYINLGREADAIRQWQESVAKGVPFGDPHVKLAEYRHKAGDVRGAIALYEDGIAVGNISEEVGLGSTHYNLAGCLEEVGDLEKAIEHLDAALALSPTDTDALFNAGMFSARLGRAESAAGYFRRYLQLDPSSEVVRTALENLPRLKAGQARGAVTGTRQATVDVLLRRFGAEAGAGRWSGAITAGLELVAVLETLVPDVGFGVVANMAAMNTKLGKQTHVSNGPIDVHVLRGYLYGEYARTFLEAHRGQMEDARRAQGYLEHEAELHMYAGMMVLSAFKLPLHQAAATRAVSDLAPHERALFEPQITALLQRRQS